MCITETWLTDSISSAQTQLSGYHCIRSDRDSRRGGGCAIYLHNSLVPSDELVISDINNNIAAVYVEDLHLILATVYRPPDAPDHEFSAALDKLQRMIDDHSKDDRSADLYITGDFNLPLFDWDQCQIPPHPPNGAYSRLMIFIEENFLSQMVNEPTRVNSILDLVLTNCPQYILDVDTELTKLSDHKLVKCLLGFNPISKSEMVSTAIEEHSFRAVNYHKANMEALNEDLGQVDWYTLKKLCDENQDYDGSMFKELLVLTVLQLTLKHSPSKFLSGGTRKNKTERELNSLKMKRRKLNRKISELKDLNPLSRRIQQLELDSNLTAYEIKDVIVNRLTQKELEAVETIKSNPKFFYSYAKRLSKSKSTVGPLKNSDGLLTNKAAEKAEILQQQYVSVFSNPENADLEACKSYVQTHHGKELSDFHVTLEDIKEAIGELDPYSAAPDWDIPAKVICGCKETIATPLWLLWRDSFNKGVIPKDLKMQYITPIYKKGNKTEAVNYRPVSLTSHLIKIFERVMRKHLVKHLEENEILPDSQHGFRSKRSCLTQLIEHVDEVLKALNGGNEVDVIYLDYSKAFDKVDHQVLLAKMKMYGINGKFYDWIKDFLSNRSQTVVVDGSKSSFQEVKSGVPQGTVLGPVFFILYVIDMVMSAKNSKTLTFADDTKLLRVIAQLLCQALLQTDLTSVIQWSIANNMVLHEDKFVVMNYCLKAWHLLRELPFSVETRQYTTTEGKILEASHYTRDLGVYLSDDCTWSYHINTMTRDARRIASWVLGAFRDRSIVTMMTLFKSLVRSKLEYCCPLWNPSKISDIQTIENLQRQFTRKIYGMSKIDYWERLKFLKLLSLQRRRERYTIIHTWKILNEKAPNNIGMNFYSSARLGIRATVPNFSHQAQKTYSSAFDNSFSVKATRLWNALPKSVNSVTKLEPFKVALGEFLTQFPDRPPATGYAPPNSNSLLDWSAMGGQGVCA